MSTAADCGGLLVLPYRRVQDANAISSPLTHGFPAISAFLGLMWALERKLAAGPYAGLLGFDGIGVICHDYQELTTDGDPQAFRLSRNPLKKNGRTAAIVEEGRIHLELSLVMSIPQGFRLLHRPAAELTDCAQQLGDLLATMRIAGGSIQASSRPARQTQPRLIPLHEDPDERDRECRRLWRQWLPGFALVARDDLLAARLIQLREAQPDASLLDAWLSLSRLNWAPKMVEEKVEWGHDREHGWIVPIPVGYTALSPLYPPGQVVNARDAEVPFRFVESLYSIGQWVSPHRLQKLPQLLWYAAGDPETGYYRACNDYISPVTPA